jgi:hypothetical protein
MIYNLKDKQYNGQKKKDQGTNRTNNTMEKRKKTKGQTMINKQKDKQYNGQKKKDQETNKEQRLSF